MSCWPWYCLIRLSRPLCRINFLKLYFFVFQHLHFVNKADNRPPMSETPNTYNRVKRKLVYSEEKRNKKKRKLNGTKDRKASCVKTCQVFFWMFWYILNARLRNTWKKCTRRFFPHPPNLFLQIRNPRRLRKSNLNSTSPTVIENLFWIYKL